MSSPIYSENQYQFSFPSLGTRSDAPPQWCALASCVVCDDGSQNILGFNSSCQLLWTISPPDSSDTLYGWTIYGSDLYVVYGAGVCHYDLSAIKSESPAPIATCALATGANFSAPVVVNVGGSLVQVYVLSSDG